MAQFKLGILKKGLLLVFVPFAINIAWISLFVLSMQRCSQWIETMGQTRGVTTVLSQSIVAINKTIIKGDFYLLSGANPAFKPDMDSTAQSLLDSLQKLKQMTESDPEVGGLADGLWTKFSDIADKLKVLEKKDDPLHIDYQRELPIKLFDSTVDDTSKIISAVRQRDATFQSSLTAEADELAHTKAMAGVGLLFNVLIALVAIFVVHKNIVHRILRLKSKARSLSLPDYDDSPIGGNDELNELETALSEVNDEIKEGQKFKRAFMTLVANNIQKPLSDCLSDVQVVESTVAKERDDECLRQIRAFETSVINCSKLIDDMLLFENLDDGTITISKSKTDLRQLVDSSLTMMRALIMRKNIHIENRAASTVVSVDRDRILQVLNNLLSNSIKFSPDGSTITIESDEDERHVQLNIVDCGPGIDEAARDKLFQKFAQTSAGQKAGGTGLGLAISRLIVDAHGGEIGVDAAETGGSVFWFYLPRN